MFFWLLECFIDVTNSSRADKSPQSSEMVVLGAFPRASSASRQSDTPSLLWRCAAGGEAVPRADLGRAGAGPEPVPSPLLHHAPQQQRDHSQRVHGSPAAGDCAPLELLLRAPFHQNSSPLLLPYNMSPKNSSDLLTQYIFFFFPPLAEKPSRDPVSGGEADRGPAGHERSG